MEQYLEYIEFIENTTNIRFDTQIAYNTIQKIKDKYYGTISSINSIDIENYKGHSYLKNLPNGEEDVLLSALVSYYTDGYFEDNAYFSSTENLFEYYLLAAANKEPVLLDLLYLKEDENISNYGKLLVTLSLEFTGDFQNAKELYSTIKLNKNEEEEYKSIVAIIETFINKKEAQKKINHIIENNPADEYIRFAILSFFQNSLAEMEQTSKVVIKTANTNETIELNGMQVKTITINSEELNTISFETESKELMVSYYYQTLLDNIEEENIVKDIKISIDGELKKGNTVKLLVEFSEEYQGTVRIALPNSLRLAENYSYKGNQKYYMQNNQIDYAVFFKQEGSTKMEIPLIVTYEGNYIFENVVCNSNGTYHISNSIDLNITK